MERRKFIVGLGSLAAAGAAGMGTGAFSSVEADRSLSVQIADDSDAYVAFSTDLGNTPHNNYEYAEINDDGEIEIEFAGNDANGLGVNPNSVTRFDDVFSVKNQGTEDAELWVEIDDDISDDIDLDFYYVGKEQPSIVGENNAFGPSWGFGVGSSFRVGIEVDTTGTETGDLPESFEGTVTFHAEAKSSN